MSACWNCRERPGNDRGGLCYTCRLDQSIDRESPRALTHGKWVARRGVRVWVQDGDVNWDEP